MIYKILIILVLLPINWGCAVLAPSGDLPEEARAPFAISETQSRANPAARAGVTEAIFHALATAGIEYRRGGVTRAAGFDCSGLVVHVYREAFGIILPHNTRAQSERTRPVAPGELQAGDLLFYNTQGKPYSHVGIFLGDGKFVHAPKPGSAVRVENMRGRYWTRRFDGARRVTLDTAG